MTHFSGNKTVFSNWVNNSQIFISNLITLDSEFLLWTERKKRILVDINNSYFILDGRYIHRYVSAYKCSLSVLINSSFCISA